MEVWVLFPFSQIISLGMGQFFGYSKTRIKLDDQLMGPAWPSILTHTDVFIHYLLIAQGVTSSKYCYIALFLSKIKIVFWYFFCC